MKQFTKSAGALAFAAIFAIALSCSDQQVKPEVPDEVSDEVRAQFKDLGFDVSDLRIVNEKNPLTGETGIRHYLLEGDIAITEENFQRMVSSKLHHVGAVGE